MSLILSNLGMSFGDRVLFSGASMNLNPGERYGVVGANGAGKSTFLSILAGQMEPSEGTVSTAGTIKVGWLRQDQASYDEVPIIKVVMDGRERLKELEEEKSILLTKTDDASGLALAEVEYELGMIGAYSAESDAKALLAGLGIPSDRVELPLRTLSGGYRLRVLLARLLFSQPDVILLDEPTNHLDIHSIAWLENWLVSNSSTVVTVSHDRDFLEKTSTYILEVDREKVISWKGNYSDWLRQREMAMELHDKTVAAQEAKREKLEGFIKRFGAKASKATQAQSRVKQLEKLEEIELTGSMRKSPALDFPIVRPSGKIAMKVHNLSHSYGEVDVLKNLSFELDRGEKVALVGANGTGKSTLVRILASKLQPTSGEVEPGHAMYLAWCPQEHHEMLEDRDRVLPWLEENHPTRGNTALRSMLGRVLFRPDDMDRRVASLSGGEATRLILAHLMLSEHNVMLFDEPTNHLDMESVEALAEALKAYEGTVVLVSHNRWLVREVATRIVELKSDGLHEFLGGYDEFINQGHDDVLKRSVLSTQKKAQEETASKGNDWAQRKEQRNRLRKLQRQVEELEKKQESMETQLKEKEDLAADFSRFSTLNNQEQMELIQGTRKLKEELEQVSEQWAVASEELEALEESGA